MHYGEKRVFIDAEICPELQDGLMVAMGWLRHWFGPEHELPRIEAKAKSSMPAPRTPERAGFFFSGGIDSFATIRANRLNFPLEHPWSIKDGLLVYGLELDESQAFDCVVDLLSSAAQEADITLIPVYTNHYLNYRYEDAVAGFRFWADKFMGAALAAVAHVFAKRFTVVSIASARDLNNQIPHGSHPLIDPNYSSSDMRIRHDGLLLSRFAKTKLVADWDVALHHLRVCNKYKLYKPGDFNCGKCEKCVRTMLALLALGVLNQTRVFPNDDVSEELASSAIKVTDITFPLYRELIGPLAGSGRYDLVHVIKSKMSEYQNRQSMGKWKAKIRQFDRQYLNGNLTKLKRLTFH